MSCISQTWYVSCRKSFLTLNHRNESFSYKLRGGPCPDGAPPSQILETCSRLILRLSLCLSVCVSVRLSLYPSVRLCVCASVRLSLYPSVRLSVCPSVCLSLYPSVRLSVSPVSVSAVCQVDDVIGASIEHSTKSRCVDSGDAGDPKSFTLSASDLLTFTRCNFSLDKRGK